MRSNLAKLNPGYFYFISKMIKLVSHQIFLSIKAKLVNKYPLQITKLLLAYPRVIANFSDPHFNC